MDGSCSARRISSLSTGSEEVVVVHSSWPGDGIEDILDFSGAVGGEGRLQSCGGAHLRYALSSARLGPFGSS